MMVERKNTVLRKFTIFIRKDHCSDSSSCFGSHSTVLLRKVVVIESRDLRHKPV
jgi:hypothetical protein